MNVTSAMTDHFGVRPLRNHVAVGATVLIAFLLGAGFGGLTDRAADDAVAAQLTAQVGELESELARRPSSDAVEALNARIYELEDELLHARTEATRAVAELSDREDENTQLEGEVVELENELNEREAKLAELETQLSEREDALAQLEGKVSALEADLDSREAAGAEERAAAQPEGGCQPGQVNINTADSQELQRIYEIGPARAEQIVALRPFGSVDELTRVSGIAEGRLGGIKAQGLACVD